MRSVPLALGLPWFGPRMADDVLPSHTRPAIGYLTALVTGIALILTITGELVIGAMPAMYALIVITGLLTRTAERRVLAWHPAQCAEVPV